jgi:hypothetical protein
MNTFCCPLFSVSQKNLEMQCPVLSTVFWYWITPSPRWHHRFLSFACNASMHIRF